MRPAKKMENFRPPVDLPVGIRGGTRPAPHCPSRGPRRAPRASTPAGVVPRRRARGPRHGPDRPPIPPHPGRPPQRRQGGRERRVLIGRLNDLIARSARPCPRHAPAGDPARRAARGVRRPGRRPHARRGRPPPARWRGGPTAGARDRARWPGPPTRGAGREPAAARPATQGDGHPPVGGDAGGDDDDGGRIRRAGQGRAHQHEADAGPPLTLLATYPGDRAEEKRLPPRFRDARLSGESFRPSRDLQSFLGWADLTRENPPRLLPNRLVTDDDQIPPTNTPVRQMSDCDT